MLLVWTLLPLIALVSGQRGGARPDYTAAARGRPNNPGECVYSFTVPPEAFRDSCRTGEVEQLIASLKQQNQAVTDENKELKALIESVRQEYEAMVNTVKKLEVETSSWREIIEWPKIEPPFEPDNASLIILNEPSFPDCWEAHKAGNGKRGIYSLQPEDAIVPFFGFCDEEGWTVIQRRFDGSVDFYRSWDDYSRGFGRLAGEFWLGLENIHQITQHKDFELRVESLGWNSKFYVSNYDDFRVESELDDYRLQIGNMSKGNYKDVMTALNGRAFSAKDRDNDDWSSANCADYYRGGWWLLNCGFDPHRQWCEGGGCMSWGDRVIKKIVIKIRPMEAKGQGGSDVSLDFDGGSGAVRKPSRQGKRRGGGGAGWG